MEMFDELNVTTISPDGTAKTESLLVGEKEFYQACKEFIKANKRFEDLDTHPDKYWNKPIRLRWWKALEDVYQSEKRVWKMFVSESPDPLSNRQYAQFREALLRGESLKPNA